MKRQHLLILSILVLCLNSATLSAQNMNFQYFSRDIAANELSSVRKITFSPGILTLLKTDGFDTVIELGEIMNLSFSNFASLLDEKPMNPKSFIKIYPNPVRDVMTADVSTDVDGIISIKSLDGKVWFRKAIGGGSKNELNINFLAKGLYILTFSNGHYSKTEKIIKQ